MGAFFRGTVMAPIEIAKDELQKLVGREVAVTDWVEITQ
jgi:hypothetical protein